MTRGTRPDGADPYRDVHVAMSVKLPTQVGNQKFRNSEFRNFLHPSNSTGGGGSPINGPVRQLLDAMRELGAYDTNGEMRSDRGKKGRRYTRRAYPGQGRTWF